MVFREFGHQLLMKAHSKDIKTKGDVLLCFVHWRLLRFGFACNGEGPTPGEVPSEVLPLNLGFDGDLQGYFLKYEAKKKQYLLSVHLKEDGVDVGLLSDSRVTKVSVELDSVVTEDMLVDPESSEDFAFLLDCELIVPHGFRMVDEKLLDKWRPAPKPTIYDPICDDPAYRDAPE